MDTPSNNLPPYTYEPPDGEPFSFVYTNYKGQTSIRNVIPIEIAFEACPEHGPDAHWVLYCWDLDKLAYRTFLLSKINVKGTVQ